MQFAELTRGTLVRRYKRFLADVELPGGAVTTVHCANPGAMTGCAPPGSPVWISTSDNPRRKLRHTWELVRVGDQMVNVNTASANALVAEALEAGRIEPLTGARSIRREVPYGSGSRVDFVLEMDDGDCYVEVKSVTLPANGHECAFPDSVTARGTRHLRELIDVVRGGDRAVLLFCVGRDPATSVQPADDIDPVYGRTLREAVAAGVEVLAYRCEISTESVVLADRVPVVIPDLPEPG